MSFTAYTRRVSVTFLASTLSIAGTGLASAAPTAAVTTGLDGQAPAYEGSAAACTNIATFAALSAIRNNPAGSYCLTKDIAATGNFTPIPVFSGVLDGVGHTISGLKITSSAAEVGLFGTIKSTGIVRNLNLVGVQVTGTAIRDATGGLAGYNEGLISNVSLSGVVVGGPPLCDSSTCAGTSVGGMVDSNRGTISNSRVAVIVSKVNGSLGGVGAMAGANSGKILNSFAVGEVVGRPAQAGSAALAGGFSQRFDVSVSKDGLVTFDRGAAMTAGGGSMAVLNPRSLGGGFVNFNAGTISQSFAAVKVRGVDRAGGFVGWNNGVITQSFASGLVSNGTECGGFVSTNLPSFDPAKGVISDSYTTSTVSCPTDSGGGFGTQNSATISRTFAAGPVAAESPGGLLFTGPATKSFWDRQTTGQSTSTGGTGRTSAQLKSALPTGFAPSIWKIRAGISYPYLAFAGTRGFVANGLLFLPIGHADKFQYTNDVLPSFSAKASRAVAFTIIARAIGANHPNRRVVPSNSRSDFLQNVAVNPFWQASTGGFPGPIANYITLGAKTAVAANTSLNATAAVPALKAGKVVLLHGTVTGKPEGHWVLATSVVVNSGNVVTRLTADDPFTGGQVWIDPVTKRAVSSPAFTLPNFKIDAFQVVTVKP